MNLEQLLEEKEKIDNKVDEIKHKGDSEEKKPEEKKESLEDRKERLKAQRELILAKKKAEREAELKEYKEHEKSGPGIVTPQSGGEKSGVEKGIEKPTGIEQPLVTEESQKRSNVYKKLKDDLM